MGTVIDKGWWKDDDLRYQEHWSMSISVAQPLESKKSQVVGDADKKFTRNSKGKIIQKKEKQ